MTAKKLFSIILLVFFCNLMLLRLIGSLQIITDTYTTARIDNSLIQTLQILGMNPVIAVNKCYPFKITIFKAPVYTRISRIR